MTHTTAHPVLRRLRALALVALAASTGCFGRASAPSPFDSRGGPEQIRITIDNQNFNDVRVYTIATTGRRTLGGVTGRSESTFQIDWTRLDELRFRLEFLAGGTYETVRINVSPGDAVFVYIPENPNNTIVRKR